MIREQLGEALKAATEAQHHCAVGVVRLILAALKERDDQARADGEKDGLPDPELIALLQAMIDQRRDSSRRYEEGGQLELAQREADEIEVIRRFLPPKLDEAACAEVVNQVIAELGACKLKDAGRVMSELKSRYPDRMDFARARRMICQQLA
ncbi:MAG: GatB/YqeY domain-containing protein [Pseudomonadota bacterium]